MEQGLENGEVEILKFKKQLIDKDIPKMYEDSEALKTLLDNPMYNSLDTPIDDAVRVLEDFKKKV